MSKSSLVLRYLLFAVILGSVSLITLHAHGAAEAWRFDCGPPDSPVAVGYQRLAPDAIYSQGAAYGWEGAQPQAISFPDITTFGRLGSFSPHMRQNLNDLNRDFVFSEDDLVFRADVPNGIYRVTVTIGDMSRAIGSMDLSVNGTTVSEHLAAWSPGGGYAGHHRRLLTLPHGWWTDERTTVSVKDAIIRIALTKNQKHFDAMMAKHAPEEQAWESAIEEQGGTPPYWRVGVKEPPYYYIGWPFVHNSIMAIEIVPHMPPPVIGKDDKLRFAARINSPALSEAVSLFNREDFSAALRALDGVTEPEAQPAKAIVQLWLVGRLETELELDQPLVRAALRILRPYVRAHPDHNGVADIFHDAELFDKALDIHVTRGEAPLGENHFLENCKAINYWWMIHDTSPLYYKSQLHIARAEHMLLPYFPARGTYREIFKKLEKKFPDNRFVKYHLHEIWEPRGHGAKYHDWYMVDYSQKVKDSPEWVRHLYPAFQTFADWCEWWIKFKQQPEGSIGGGWGDDVEIVGAFGYMGYVSPDISDILVEGTARLVNGVWFLSEVDPELGFCLPFTDAEHAAEWTGNTLGMMVQLDYGNPAWIERSLKTAKLLRDLWTDYDINGRRHWRADYFSASQIGTQEFMMNDSWINYRAVRPAAAVLWYNQNPTISSLFVELADSWLAAAMSTERGKPRGVIPAKVSFPEGILGGKNSANWYDARLDTGYKAYMHDLFLTAFKQTRDPKYIEPLRLEYALVSKYGTAPEITTGARLQSVTYPQEFGKRDKTGRKKKKKKQEAAAPELGERGSEEWVAKVLGDTNAWLLAKRMMQGRKGSLENDLTKEDIIRSATRTTSEFIWRWPLHTTEAGPTDRIGFVGMINPFLVYTGGRIGGPLLEAAVTYRNSTRDFAAAVIATDPQGFRLLYHSLTPDTRTIEIVPWHLEPGGTYVLRYGPDADEDEAMDSVLEQREFTFPQLGTPVQVTVAPRITYVIEVDQIERGRGPELAPDPGLSADDIRYIEARRLILARIHNVGSLPVRAVRVAAYDGDPQNGGTPIGTSFIPSIEAPISLEPKTVTVGFPWTPSRESHEIYVVIDPDDEIKDEITTFNNVAHKTLPEDRPLTEVEKIKAGLAEAFGPGGP